ncbi:MAG TPA: TfoX/Sxy family protein [Acetobacteraceae bacterium]|nr:TfoX/Sxy family protein [Acetobacteraceae bacterium]
MPVGAEFQAFVLDLLGPLRPSARRMFGGVGIMRDGMMFALLSDDTMYFRVDERTRARFQEAGCDPFRYRRAGREVSIASYYAVPDALYDEPDVLLEWAREAVAAAQDKGRKRK